MLLKRRFCKNVDTKDLSISVAAGQILLKNVEVKASAFDELQLPITIKSGTVRRVCEVCMHVRCAFSFDKKHI